jgi:hypothetical protein
MEVITMARLACIGCGCTENRACMTDDGPCCWVSTDPPLCSACDVEQNGAVDEPRGANAPCPASPRAAPHQLLWTGDTEGYCVRCRTSFMRFAA